MSGTLEKPCKQLIMNLLTSVPTIEGKFVGSVPARQGFSSPDVGSNEGGFATLAGMAIELPAALASFIAKGGTTIQSEDGDWDLNILAAEDSGVRHRFGEVQLPSCNDFSTSSNARRACCSRSSASS